MNLPLSDNFQTFISEHADDDTTALLLAAKKYPDIDMPWAVDQIEIRKRLRDKLPEWWQNKEVVFPSRIAAEQCSSSLTGNYKCQLMRGNILCDLTGGTGVDTFFLSQNAQRALYIDRFENYCECAKHNFKVLENDKIQVINGDCTTLLPTLSADTFYIDPARRSDSNKRLFALSDCQPDILKMKDGILQKAQRLIIKISPMADITETLRLLPETIEIHIIATRNECKELLFVLEKGATEHPHIYTVNFTSSTIQKFDFLKDDEAAISDNIASSPIHYLYEPNAAIMKSGAFKLIANQYHIQKLHRHTHLYTSDALCDDFPGRKFFIEEVVDFSSKSAKSLGKQLRKANISTRNFPMSPDELRKKYGFSDGGDCYLFATTCRDERRVFILCRKA